MIKSSAISILGPNGVGKTSVAFELARRINGEVINLDKVYIYKHFPISTGLADTLKERGVRRHLYELLEPNEGIIPADTYVEMVKEKCIEITSRGKTPIIEGGSTTYGPVFLNANDRDKFCRYIFGLRISATLDQKVKFRKRIEEALEEGLLDEIKNGLKNYGNSLIMQDAYFVVPMTRYLRGELNLEEAKKEVVARCLKYAKEQLKLFSKYPEITWLEHKPGSKVKTVKKIISILKSN